MSVLPSLLLGGVSAATALASSLPGLLIRLLLMVISHLLHRHRLEKIVRFILGCPPGNTRNVVLQIKAYVVGTLFVCIRSTP